MRVAILGNAGSGKTTLARELAGRGEVAVLDLDTVAWDPDADTPVRRAPHEAAQAVRSFCAARSSWVVEGCYGDLVAEALAFGPELVFLNPGEAECLRRCRGRAWEPHKFASPAEQEAALAFLLTWVADYAAREDDTGLARHRALYEAYAGPKREVGPAGA